jgi:alpha-methylacyl-CoA racemase
VTSADPHVLSGIRVIELAAKGPTPFGVMMLADLGAEVIRVERPSATKAPAAAGAIDRGRRTIGLDLKAPEGLELLLALVASADVLVEGQRPGVAERLGFGPDVCLQRNPRLVYARMTGWGQDGPLAQRAGHDINFVALAGGLLPIGSADRPPPPPLNLVGDFGGGATFLVIGILAALLERERSGTGQVVDAAMVDGVASLLTAYHELRSAGAWSENREDNVVDGGAPWYRTYATADGRFVAVGCLEPKFWAILLERLGLDPEDWPAGDRAGWPEQRAALARIFGAHPRAHWEQLFEGTDACVSPVLSLGESTRAAHLVARGAFCDAGGTPVPRPAPRLSRTPPVPAPAAADRDHTEAILDELAVAPAAREHLRRAGVVA